MYKIEIDNKYKGYRYVVAFIRMGHRCGYVGVDKCNPLYGKSYTDKLPILKKADVANDEVGKRGIIPLLAAAHDEDEHLRPDAYFDVHGGLTYSSSEENCKYPIESELWWFGFDCSHYNDGKDLKQALEYGLIDEERYKRDQAFEDKFPTNGIMRSMEYVEQECKNLIDQIIKVSGNEIYYVFLDELRESGVTNMYGAVPYLKKEFPDLSHEQACSILAEWMLTFSERTKLNGYADQSGLAPAT